jgi:hypothetical protein
MFVAQIAKMPGPEESLGKDENSRNHDGESYRRGRMSQMVTRAEKEY